MVHENADRAHVPGQPQVPERDIEPLWPPEQTEGVVTAPPWAAPAQPNVAAWPVPPTQPTPPAADPAPSAAEPAADGEPAGGHVPPHPTHAPVDLNLPFTLDQPAPVPTPATPETTSPQPATSTEMVDAAGTDTVDADGAVSPNETAGGPNGAVDPAGSPGGAGAAHVGGPLGTPAQTTPEAIDVIQADVEAGADGMPGGAATSRDDRADTPPNGRPESPWAQPPQRSSGDTPTPSLPGPVPPPTRHGTAAPAHPDEATTTPATPPDQAPSAPEATGAAQGVPGGVAEGSPDTPPRLGPFPPSPGVPLQQPYGDGTAYPPGPVGYGQPAPQPGAPGWYPPAWPQQAGPPPQPGTPQQPPAPPQPPGPHQPGPHQLAPHQPGPHQPAPHQPTPHQPVPPQPGPQQPGPAAYPEQVWTPASGAPPTAEDFARRRQARPVDPVATMGVRAVVNKIGLVRLAPGRQEQEMRRDIEMVRRNFGGLRQVTVVNPKGGAGKTVAILLLAMTFGQKRGGYVLAWDNNETQGTLGMRAQQDFHARTVRDMLRDLAQFQGPHGRVGDLSQYVRSQGEGMFDVLASDESATGGEMLTAAAFAEIREVVSRFYKLIFVDTGNNVRAQNWQAAMDATDQLVVTMSARNDSAETAARMLDHLEQSGRQRLVRQAVTVVSMPPSRKEIDLPAIQEHFAARTRAVLLAPYERLIDTGEPIRYGQLSSATRDAWLKIAASVAEGL
ncbi:chromosome partitioning protein [Micromonospora sp. NPDC004551]|uniref:chromosome partitioning protein n=1 Tax=Micromonospora sp. NPDC004551 TaxID=3154284 RepID=UPI0033A38D27